jgi:hypothetical protein
MKFLSDDQVNSFAQQAKTIVSQVFEITSKEKIDDMNNTKIIKQQWKSIQENGLDTNISLSIVNVVNGILSGSVSINLNQHEENIKVNQSKQVESDGDKKDGEKDSGVGKIFLTLLIIPCIFYLFYLILETEEKPTE